MGEEEERIRPMDFDWRNHYSASKLSRAVKSQSTEMVKKLIRKGCSLDSPDNRGWTPLHEVAVADHESNLQIAELLIAAGAYIDHKTVEGETPLVIACKYESEKIAKAFIDAGCEVNAQNNEYLSPLHIACSRRNQGIINLLIAAGGDLDATDDEERTPIYLALENVNTKAIEILIQVGANMKTKDFFSRTPLQYSCMIGNLEIFDMLIEHLGHDKSVIDQQTPEGWTLLMEAVQYKNYLIAEKLINYGTDTTLVDNRGLLALHIAAHCERYNLIELLLKHTPKHVIEKYSTFGPNMTHYRSLPCLIIDKNVYEGLDLLYKSGLSEAVLKCPAKMGDRLVSPISFLLLHGYSIHDREKVRFLEFLLNYDYLIDSDYILEDYLEIGNDSDVKIVSPIEAAVTMHRHSHKDCYCETFLSMILAKGASPDKTRGGRFKDTFLMEKAALGGFSTGIDLMLRYSECTEPGDLLETLVMAISQPGCLWTVELQETDIISYLLSKSTHFGCTLELIRSSCLTDLNHLAAVVNIHKNVKSSINVVSLQRICRTVVRKHIRQQSPPYHFRQSIANLRLPTSLIQYLLYQIDF